MNATAQKSELVNQVDVRTYKVIYELIADIDKALKGLLEPVYEEAPPGKAEVRAVFRIPRRGKIAGCLVTTARSTATPRCGVTRNGAG